MFVSIYNFFQPRPWLARLIFALSFIGFLALASRIHFDEDISSMLPDSKGIRTMNEVLMRTQAGEKVILLASLKDTSNTDRDSLISLTNTYYQGLEKACGQWIGTISLQAGNGLEERISGIVSGNLPLLLRESDYKKIDSLTQPEEIAKTLAANKKILISPASVIFKNIVAADPIGVSRIVWSRLSQLQYDPNFDLYEGYLFSKNGRKLTFFLKPKARASATGKNSQFFSALNDYNDQFERQHPEFEITYFGGPAVAAGNASQMRTDSIITLSVTILLLMLLSLYYFKKKRTPLLLLLPVLYGSALGLAVVYLFQGSISIIALGAGAIVMGIAMDYAIHFLSHARDAKDMRETIADLQKPLTIGSFTTIAAFFSLRFVHLPLLRDLGLFAAVALIGAAVCTLVFLPHLPLGKRESGVRKPGIFDRLAHYDLSKSKVLLIGIVLLTPVMIWQSFNVKFDDDLMHLNYLSPRMQKAQDEVNKVSAFALSSQFVIAEGKSSEQALEKLEAVSPIIDSMQRKGFVHAVLNPTLLIPSDKEQMQRKQRWESFWSADKIASVKDAVTNAAAKEGFAKDAFSNYFASLAEVPKKIDTADITLLQNLFPGGFSNNGKGTFYAVAALKTEPSKRAELRDDLIKHPGIVVTDRQQVASQMVQLLNNDFQNIALYSSLIVFFALLIAYGRIELAIISFLPMAISWIWILGLMALLGIKFNIVNIIISTLIFGLGDDYAIFTLDGLQERYKTRSDHTPHVRAAVYVSVATVLIGLGALLLARHPALHSIAAISVTGMICVVLISQVLQPFLFNLMIQRRADKGFHPFTAWSLLKSTFAFSWFVFVCMVGAVVGFFLVKLHIFGKHNGKILFHKIIRRGTWSVMYIMGNVRKRVINRDLADFSKPAVYTANHASFLDILIVTMLHPMVVLLTNKWVYRSPIFGAVVRMAEYYPVADGAEDSLEPLRSLVSRGYSIIVFPEGTRSKTGAIQRFRKGAFFIAERLQLDLVPLVIHGASYTMQKGDWLLKDGTCAVNFYPRYAGNSVPAGISTIKTTKVDLEENDNAAYSIRTKLFNRWYREELHRLKVERETPRYFREQTIRSFTYKGPILEWYCRIKTRLEGNYEKLHEVLPREGKIYDLGCGYGFATHLLNWSAPERELIGVDYDENKIIVANSLHLKGKKVRFETADLRDYSLEKAEAIILSDVLHYLIPEEQEGLLQACVDALNPSGKLIIRDGVTEDVGKHKTTAITEIFSTKVFDFNKKTNELHFLSRAGIEAFAARNGMKLEMVKAAKMTSNVMFVLEFSWQSLQNSQTPLSSGQA
ncbi:MAG: MMPL family transporter [Chitinophagaceae bacterium]